MSDADDLSFLRKIHFAAEDVGGVLRPTITQHQLAGVCAVSRSAVAMSIKGMKESGGVSRQGSDRKGTWVVYK